MDRQTAVLAAAFVLLWNSGFIGAEFVLPHAGPLTQIFWRYLALAGLLGLGLAVFGRFRWPGATVAVVNGGIGALAHAVWLGAVLLALQAGVPAGIVALVIALQPLLTGLFSGRVAHEGVTPRKWLGILIGFAGVVFTVAWRVQGASADVWLAYLLPFLAALAMAIAALMQRRFELISPRFSLPLGLTLFYQSLASVGILFFPAWLIEGLRTNWTVGFFLGEAWLIVGVSFGAYSLMWLLLKRLDATRVESLFYLGPPVTMLMSWLAFGDTLKQTDMIGLATVFVGVFLTSKRENGGGSGNAT
jgi:drug/metabolite transporter (DMT)-like permease